MDGAHQIAAGLSDEERDSLLAFATDGERQTLLFGTAECLKRRQLVALVPGGGDMDLTRLGQEVLDVLLRGRGKRALRSRGR